MRGIPENTITSADLQNSRAIWWAGYVVGFQLAQSLTAFHVMRDVSDGHDIHTEKSQTLAHIIWSTSLAREQFHM